MKEISLVLLQRFIQQILIGHLLREWHGARCLGLQWQTKHKEPLPSQSCSDRVKVSLVLEHDGGHLSDPTGCWPPKGHSRDHLGNWDKSRERVGLSGCNSSRRNYFQVIPHFAYKHGTVQKYSNVKPLFKIKEEITGQISPNELSKHTLRINSGLLDVHFPICWNALLVKGKRLRLYNIHHPHHPKYDFQIKYK